MSKRSRRRPSLFWPLLLIGVGVVLLLSNLGILPENAFSVLWRFWPLVLVIIGLDVLLGRRGVIGPMITAVLVLTLFVCVIGFLLIAGDRTDLIPALTTNQLQEERINYPLENFQTARITIDWANGPATLFPLSDSNQLIDGEIRYAGTLYFDTDPDGDHLKLNLDTRNRGFFFSPLERQGDQDWSLGLNPRVRYALILDAGSGPGDYDLSRFQLESLDVDGGSGPIKIVLPEQGVTEGVIDGGSGPITLILPERVEARIRLDNGLGPFTPSPRFERISSRGDDEIWETANYNRADNRLELEIDQGSGPIEIRLENEGE